VTLYVVYKETLEGEKQYHPVSLYGTENPTTIVFAGDYCSAVEPVSPAPVSFVGSDTVKHSGARCFYFEVDEEDGESMFRNFRCWAARETQNMGVYPLMISLNHTCYENDLVYLDTQTVMPVRDPGRNSPNIPINDGGSYIQYGYTYTKTELLRVQLEIHKSPISTGTYNVDFKLYFAWEEIP